MIKIMRKISCLLLLAGFCLPAMAADIEDFRIWSGPDKTRAVLDLDGPVEHQLFTLQNPPRVVIDIPRAGLNTQFALPASRSAGPLSRIRHGVRANDTLRVVFDLNDDVKPKSFLLSPVAGHGHRLVIDLFPLQENEVIATPTWEPNPEREVIVAIDAGHGGEDPGAIGPHGVREKEVTLQIARRLHQELTAMPGISSFLVRDGDYYIEHRQRYEAARARRADLFVSIHADAFKTPRPSGSSVYILSRNGASSEAARLLANSENRADEIGGVYLGDKEDTVRTVILELSQSGTLQASDQAADSLLGSLKTIGKVHKDHVERANFAVLRSPDVPSVLVETAFISNPQEEARLKDPVHQARLAKAMATGIEQHFHNQPPPGTWIANHRRPSRHIVSRGDTLGAIANHYQTSVSSLRQANGLRSDNILVGTVLVIPST